jgi:Ctr copper transporter family
MTFNNRHRGGLQCSCDVFFELDGINNFTHTFNARALSLFSSPPPPSSKVRRSALQTCLHPSKSANTQIMRVFSFIAHPQLSVLLGSRIPKDAFALHGLVCSSTLHTTDASSFCFTTGSKTKSSTMDHSAHGGGHSAAAGGVWVLESEMADMPPFTSFCTGGGTVMQNGFHSSFSNGSCVLWLFEGAVLDTAGKYIAALIGTFLLAFLNEFIRYARARALQEKAPFTGFATMSPVAKDFLLALGYGFQMLIAYWIMLLVMLYEVLIFVAILAGLAAGYFTFNRIDNRRKLNPDSSCECSDETSAATAAKLNGTGNGTGNGKTAASTPPNGGNSSSHVTAATPCCGGV